MITGSTGVKMAYPLLVRLNLGGVWAVTYLITEAGTIERALTKFDPDREKMSSGLRGDHAEERYARKHNAGEISIARLSPISTNRSAESRTYTQIPAHIQTSTNR